MGATFDITVESGGSFTIEVVDAGGDFTIETPSLAASFTIEAANVGPKGDTGATGSQGPKGDKGDTGNTGPKGDKGDTGDTGVVSATAPLAYNSVAKNLSIDLTGYATESWVTSQGYLTGPYNPFDQTLNTTDYVNFRGVWATDSGTFPLSSMSGTWNYANGRGAWVDTSGTFHAGSGDGSTQNISVDENGITFTDSTVQTTAWTGSYNPFDQTLNTTDTVNFGSVLAPAGRIDNLYSGDVSGGNYFEFEAGGNLVPHGTAVISGYATQSYVTSQGYITSAALSPYLTNATAASTYQTISGMSSYLTTSSAASTYLTQSNAASTYQTQSGMSAYLTTASAASTYLTQSNAATTYAPIAAGVPTGGTTGQALVKSSNSNYATSWTTLQLGDRYLTSSTTSLTISNATKTLTVGTGLAYTTQQTVVIAYDATNHMHGTVTSYNSGTGVMVVDVSQKSGSGTYASWTVNVAGITSVPAWGDITGTLSNQTDLQSALDAKLAVTTAASTYLTQANAASTYQTQSGMSSYLTTASAASTYQTQSGMSSYALLAGPTFTGVPKAPTAATSDNTTQIATTAFVKAQGYLTTNAVSSVAGKTGAVTLASTDITDFSTAVPAAVPSASTSTAGKVLLATDINSLLGTNNTAAVTPYESLLSQMTTAVWIAGSASLSTTTAGTGANSTSTITALSGRLVAPNAATTGYACRGFTFYFPSNSVNSGTNYSVKSGFSVKMYTAFWATARTDVKMRVVFGRQSVNLATPGTLAARGYGLEFNFATSTMSIIAHNGTTLTTTAMTWTPVNLRTYELTCLYDGAGTVTFYVDGALIGTSTGGPTGTSATSNSWWQMEIENTTTSAPANTDVYYSNPKVFLPNG